MTDTTILDGMMELLERNPLNPERLGHVNKKDVEDGQPWGVDLQFKATDIKPFYARREVVSAGEANPNFSAIADLFHQDLSAPRLERPRRGSCPRLIREFDGTKWIDTYPCPGPVHAVETIVNGAARVDGKCLTCGVEVHRAGLVNEKG